MARTFHHNDPRFDSDDEPRRDFRPFEDEDDERPWMNDEPDWNDEDWFDDDWAAPSPE